VATVRFSGVTKRYQRDVAAVDELDLDIADGEFLVVLGPSGCGKSTVLRLIAGLESPDDGTIEIDGRRMDGVDPKDRDVAMVFQSYALYPHMTVRQNVAFSLAPRGLARPERDREVMRVAALLGLTELLDRKPRELSGGEQQRVALARALVRRPAVFLMDEPLSNLDAQRRTETRADLVRLQRDLGTTLVYVTHDQVEALTMAGRIAVLAGGRLQQVGTPQEVYDRPANAFVAGFLGTPPMNLWPAVIDPDGVVRVDGVEIARDRTIPAVGSGDVTVGVRPESVRPAAEGDGGLPARVLWVEDLGHEHLVGGVLSGGSPVALRWAGATAPPGIDAEVHLGVDPGALHWFDALTGERVG
jgi:multiple sugar transport system ATP-binding protein